MGEGYLQGLPGRAQVGKGAQVKNRFQEACEDEGFVEWFARFQQSANYFVALHGDKQALELCVAYAWVAAIADREIRARERRE